jgi:hypothetical protein
MRLFTMVFGFAAQMVHSATENPADAVGIGSRPAAEWIVSSRKKPSRRRFARVRPLRPVTVAPLSAALLRECFEQKTVQSCTLTESLETDALN